MKRFLSVVVVNVLRGAVATATIEARLVVGMIFLMAISLIFSPFQIPLIEGYLRTFRAFTSRFTTFIRPFF